MSRQPVNVYLTGGEQTGWALDADVATTRRALDAVPDLVRVTGIEDAEIVHSVWEEEIIRMDAGRLNGKRILCHICNEVMRTFEMPVMMRSGERIGLWIPISREAEKNLRSLGYRSIYMPYTVDTSVFTQDMPPGGQDCRILRKRWNIPKERYIISNFMRDSRANNLSLPKPQKGVELFLEILRGLQAKKLPIHVLLAGPRRHWLRVRLREAGIPFTFVGRDIEGDDNSINVLDPRTINLLYHVSDLHLVTSRWEGGPRAALEAAATRTKIISTPVGMSCDLLESACLFRSVDEGIKLVKKDISDNRLFSTLEPQYRRILEHHVPEANVPILREIYQSLADVPVFRTQSSASNRTVRPGALARKISTVGNIIQRVVGRGLLPAMGLCFGFWHEFHKPPYGGGNQFMLALRRALRRQGARVISNRMSQAIDVHLCNSAWFNRPVFERALSRGRVRMIHRVDGPVALYRGADWSEDERIHEINRRWASATVFQSAWSFRSMKEHGLDFVRPVIIRNGVDPDYFHPPVRLVPAAGRKIRIISTSWSDNPNKGGALYQWLDEHLDFNRFEYTYVGRIQFDFSNIRHIPPQDSRHLGELLRQHDLYITASRNEPCSNALLEAMACSLPALYLNQGGHGELVGFGGLPFDGPEDLLTQLDLLAGNLDAYRNCIWLQTIDEIAKRYIELVRLLVSDAP